MKNSSSRSGSSTARSATPKRGSGLDKCIGPASQSAPQHHAFDVDVAEESAKPLNAVDRDGLVEMNLDPADRPPSERLDRLDCDESSVADDPDPVRALLDLTQHV